jgi:hypothetical protein
MKPARMLKVTGVVVLSLALLTGAFAYQVGMFEELPPEKRVGGHELALDVTRASLAKNKAVLYNTLCEYIAESKAMAGGEVECIAEDAAGRPVGLTVKFEGTEGDYVLERI